MVAVRASFPEGRQAATHLSDQLRQVRATCPRSFRCNAFFGPDAPQHAVFEAVAPLVEKTLQGHRSAVYCVGATGSGKTHTMVGPPESPGIAEHVARHLFKFINERMSNGDVYILEGSFLEVHVAGGREQLVDLLAPSERPLEVRQDPLTLQGYVCEGLRRMPIRSAEEMRDVFMSGQQRHRSLEASRRAANSRSHLMFTLGVESLVVEGSNPSSEHLVQRGKLALVQLAGSENFHDEQATGPGVGMEKVMACLGAMVSNGGAGPKPHQRDTALSKLTEGYSGPAASSLLIFTVAPELSQAVESLRSLRLMHQMSGSARKPAAAQQSGTSGKADLEGIIAAMRQRHSETVQTLHDHASQAHQQDSEHRRRMQDDMEDMGRKLMTKAAAEKTLEDIRTEQGRLFNDMRKEMGEAMTKEFERLRLQSQSDLEGLSDSVHQKVVSLDNSRHLAYTEEHASRINETQGELREAVRLQRTAEEEASRLREKLAAAEERAKLVQARHDELRKERAAFEEERRRLRQEAESQWARLSVAEGEMQRCKAEAEVHHTELARLTATHNEDLDALRKDREAWRQREAELQTEISDIQRRLDETKCEADLRAMREEAERREALSHLRVQVERLEGEAKLREEQLAQAEEACRVAGADLEAAHRREDELKRQGAEDLRQCQVELEEAKTREKELLEMLDEVQQEILHDGEESP